MTDKQKKILIYTIGGIVAVAGLTYGICSIIIWHNYKQVLTAEQADNTLSTATQDAAPITVQSTDNTADVSTGSTMGADDPNLTIDTSGGQ